MAGIAHLGIGLMFSMVAPDVHVVILITCAYLIDIIFLGFMFAGLEDMPRKERIAEAPWSHSLFMAVIWSGLAMVVANLFTSNLQTSLIIGLLVFSHWVVDFIVSPMTYAFPTDTGKLLHPFGGSSKVGLGLMRTKAGVIICEGGSLILGVGIFILTLI
ncbi:MAG: hypothetical protein ACW964_05690 [Candidatus Hodarchaeales archaeon]|jgi:hypothetical protein